MRTAAVLAGFTSRRDHERDGVGGGEAVSGDLPVLR